MMYKTDSGRYIFIDAQGRAMEWPASKALKIINEHGMEVRRCDDHNFSWPDIHQFVKSILTSIKKRPEFVTCPTGRGGLVPAAMISYRLDVPFIPWVNAENTTKGLCIDDILDTGATFQKCMDEKPLLLYAALVARWRTYPQVPVGRIVKTPEYVIFPWDNGT